MRRILTIDGGGIKGVFPAAYLAAVEDIIGDRVSNYFDLVVGTSTGGIIALGLGLGWTAAEMLSFYEELGPKIFPRLPFWRRIAWAARAKYDPKPLHRALERKFKGKRIGESTVRLVVPSVNLDTGEVYVYKTAHCPRFKVDYKRKAIEAARATSAAPSYFPSYTSEAGNPLVDGGMWANNPAAVAAVEAVGVLNWERDEVVMLSLGCTCEPYDGQPALRRSRGLGYWGMKASELFMTTQSSSSTGMARLLLGKKNVVRCDPTVPRGRFTLDDTRQIRWLKGLGESEARKAIPMLEERFFMNQAEPFMPYYQLDET